MALVNKAKAARVVIGAGFGDEGKGIITARLANILHHMSNMHNLITPVVVRFNGGAQASHTVENDGFRHAFSHFGSGSLASYGARTHLTDKFIINVDLFLREKEILNAAGYQPTVSVDPAAKVTLPIDMVINQVVELSRDTRHGSCGLGINETVTRYERWSGAAALHAKLHRIPTDRIYEHSPAPTPPHHWSGLVFGCDPKSAEFVNSSLYQWFRTRLHEHGLSEQSVLDIFKISKYSTCVEFIGDIMSTWFERWDNFITRSVQVCQLSAYSDDPGRRQQYTFIFEGAQGLELDEVNGVYPHVTRSRTGSTNVIEALTRVKHVDGSAFFVDLHYVSRIYKTRHGAGPLAHERTLTEMSDVGYNIQDLTNVPNEFQGTLRYGLLDVDALHARIREDLRLWAASGIVVRNKTLEITCVDQLRDAALISHVRAGEPTVSNSIEHFKCHALKAFIEDDFQINFHYSPAVKGA